MNESNIAYVGLGSNLGDRKKYIDDALKMLTQTEGILLLRSSDVIETTPLAGSDQSSYLNTVAELQISLSPQELLKKILDVEAALGRTRNVKWSPRTIDLDLILFGDAVFKQTNFILPHPQMHLRSFVLMGLCQLNPKLVHPLMKVDVSELAARLNNLNFKPGSDVPQLVSIAGLIGAGKTTLATKLSERLNCQLILEPYDWNPYLPQVYAGRKELALDCQLSFLTDRFGQLNAEALKSSQLFISDYLFDKELIYANLLLDQLQMDLYKRIFDLYNPQISSPVLVIYLTDSPQNCLERIKLRNRPYEQRIEISFLESLLTAHEELMAGWKKSPLIKIRTTDLDYSKPDTVENLVNQIKFYINVPSTKQKLTKNF
jgi:2-amino-4-hydroxy-6-hydroxymethyldihydropteridine diphosphokinase